MPNNSANPFPEPNSYPDLGPNFNSMSGQQVTKCTRPGLFALTYDDGVNLAQDEGLLRVLAEEGVVATFFINGYNWHDLSLPEPSRILKKIQSAGHQIACKS